uniref:Uncharacterized protein n=1 Tax=Arundo donax TaxID=35708 RepID=A0A0A9GAN9_ARUDO
MGMIMRDFGYDGPRESRHHCYKPRPHYKPKLSKKVGPPASAAPAVAPPVAAPLPAFQPEVVAVGREAHVEEVDDHRQFEAARHQPQVEAVQGQTMLVQPITHTDLF